MSNTNPEIEPDDLPDEIEFDYRRAKPNRFAAQFARDQLLIALDADVAAVFGDAESVNRVLRALIETMPRPSR